jgi:hypothetical protein
MRARLVMILVTIGAATFVAGCASRAGTPTSSATSPPTRADNGVSALAANEILEKAKTALGDAKSVRIRGSATEGNDQVDFDFKISGDDIDARISGQGMTVEIIRIGADAYMKADALWEALLAGQPRILSVIKGRYVKINVNDDRFTEFTELTDPEEILDPEGNMSKGEVKAINGTPAIGLVDQKDRSTLSIATVGEPRPLRVEEPAGNTLDFAYDEAVTVSAPPAAEVVDASTLNGF